MATAADTVFGDAALADAIRTAGDPGRPHITDFHTRRAEIVTSGLDLASLDGLEIGPLTAPMVAKSAGRITYVDHADTASLVVKYGVDPAFDTARIVEVDAVWDNVALLDAIGGEPRHYVIASHVAEHVPDLISWFAEVARVLRPGGQLRIVLPDKRFSADALREETRMTDLLAAWLEGHRRPQVRDIIDTELYYAPAVDGWGLYEGRATLEGVAPQKRFEEAMDAARHVRDVSDLYHDVHCWVFQPKRFATLMAEIAAFGLLDLACCALSDAVWPMLEFYVFMRPCADRAETVASWREAASRLSDHLPGSAQARLAAGKAAALPLALSKAAALERQLAASQERVRALEASASWRLTAPLRRVRSALGR